MTGINEAGVARARPRRKLFQPAELETGGGRLRVHLLDLSESGALIDAASPPPADSFVGLSCGGMRRSARVAWVRGRRFGIAFVLPLSAGELEQVLQLGQRAVVDA